ncbi:hypothetical protein [Legionella sainthelensi]|uniref:hypothetical protein n=1 Tax=Legionella sainthelensi TaxID=28087 RepID=UPI002165E08E|nr:hypothetical protein [Legionella sainthelensi]
MFEKSKKEVKGIKKEDSSLLIVILADDYKLKMAGLPIIHALSHARKHSNTSAIIVMTNGDILDVATDLEKVKLDTTQRTQSDEAYLPKALNQLKDEIKPLSDGNFDLSLVIGGEPGEINITEALAMELFKFNKARMNEKGVIRIQICNFADKKIGDSTNLFANEITPPFCSCSIPEGYSIIAPRDTRAIDLPKEEGPFLGAINFNQHKGRLKGLLSSKNSNEEIIKKIPAYIAAEIVDLNELYKKNTSPDLSF